MYEWEVTYGILHRQHNKYGVIARNKTEAKEIAYGMLSEYERKFFDNLKDFIERSDAFKTV